MKIKLTEKTVAKLKAPTKTGRQEVACDVALKGFAVLLSGVTASKTYIAQRTVAGTTRRITIGPTSAIKTEDARKRAEEIIIDLIAGKDPKAKDESLTVAVAVESYIAKKGAKLRPRTAALYRGSVRYLKRLENLQLADLTPKMVEEQYALVVKTFGPGAANNAMRTLRAVYNSANRDGTLPANPVRLQDHWVKLQPRKRHVRGDDLTKFFAAAWSLPNKIHRDYVLMLLFTGLRRRTAAAIRWDDVDFSAGVIRLPAESMKSGESFDLPLTDLVRGLLISRQGREEFVFPSTSGSGHIEEPRFIFAQIEEACGIKVSPHDLRRTFATTAERVVSGIALKGLLHHSSGGNVTSDYVMLSAKELAHAAQLVADRIRELCQIAPYMLAPLDRGRLAKAR